MRRFLPTMTLVLHGLAFPALADSQLTAGWEWFKQDVKQTWQQPKNYDLYLPFMTWHARFAYDKEKTDKYNENPWGGGFGISRYHDDGEWTGLYAMMFKDSHNEWQPIMGYGWEHGWYPDEQRNFRFGLGLTAAITAREDIGNYVPVPIVLPLVSAGYKRFNIQFTYIPGTYNNGNVLFGWMRFAF